MLINILGSSSKGNCILFNNDLMIDIGLNFSQVKPFLSEVKYVLLTHIHKDHFNPTTIRKIYTSSNVIFVCPIWIYELLLHMGFEVSSLMLVDVGQAYEFGNYKINPIKLYHDVDNIGYRILWNGLTHIHATDTAHLDGIMAVNYDSATLECNHDEVMLNELIQVADSKGEFTHLKGAKNSHLSVQQAVDFVKKNNIKKLYPCHIGNATKQKVMEFLQNENLS